MRILYCLALCAAAAGQELPSLETVLDRVRANASAFDSAIPDFVAVEKMRSTEIEGGKIRRENTAESVFTCVKFKQPNVRGFQESRDVQLQDGKPATGLRLKGPAIFSGGFSNLAGATFTEKNAEFQEFRLEGVEVLAGKPAIVVAFNTRPGQTGMRLGRNGKWWATEDTGKAWIDPVTFQILRFERHFTGLPGTDRVTMRVNFSETKIEGQTFWLPASVEGVEEEVRGKKHVTGTFNAEYTQYRKFGSSSDIKFDAPE